MKISRLFALAAAACFAMVSVPVCWVRPTFAVVAASYRKVKNWILDGFKLAAATVEGAKTTVLFVQAKAFMLRIAKRERPEVSGSWRMCPST